MKKALLFLLMAMITSSVSAQSDDFGLWTTIGVTKKIDKKWDIDFEVENRLQDNLGALDRWTAAIGGSYKPTKWLKFDVGYKFIYYNTLAETKAKVTKYADDEETEIENIKIRTSDPYWNTRHRFSVSATLKKKFGYFEVSLREQWQYNYRTATTTTRSGSKYKLDDWEEETISNEVDSVSSKSTHLMRSRLQVQYDRKGFAWQPYASVEMYNGGSSFGIQKMRYTVGVEYKINKQNSVELFYRYQRKKSTDNGESLLTTVENTVDDSGSQVFSLPSSNYDASLFGNNDRNSHIIGIGYKFKF